MRVEVFLSACLAAAGLYGAGAVEVAVGEPFARVPPFPASASGITHCGGTNYWVVADDASTGEVGLYRAAIVLSGDGLSVTSATAGERIALEGCADLEAVARDPLTGNVWAADEKNRTIAEYDPATGARLRFLECPPDLTNTVENLGFESLAISEDGLSLWTANEEATLADGPRSSFKNGTTVRLVKFVRKGAKDAWRHAKTVPYTTEKWTLRHDCGKRGRRGVSELCVLPDGSLLVMERELSSSVKGSGMAAAMAARFFHELFRVTADGAKTSLYKSGPEDPGSILSNCEGMCLGPRTADGRLSLVMVTDAGDGFTCPQVRPYAISLPAGGSRK